MLQRIQSVWLLLAAVCAFATFRFPFYSGTNAKGVIDAELTASGSFLIMLTTIVVGGLALVTIFLYKKRPLQRFLCVAGVVLEALLIFLYYKEADLFLKGNYSLTAIFHVLILYFFIMAFRGISNDEKLVKDSDRLR